MSVQRIEKIEQIIIKDPGITNRTDVCGIQDILYKLYICIFTDFFHSREIAFIDRKNVKTSVELDHKIEDIDIYHEQFGIPFSQEHNCFLSAHGQRAYFAVIKRLEN